MRSQFPPSALKSLTFTLKENAVLNIGGQSVVIQYVQYDEKAPEFMYAKGFCRQTKREYYFITATGNKAIEKVLDFSRFKQEKSNFIFILNFKLAEGAEITLPVKAKECFIIHQQHYNYQITKLNRDHYYIINVEDPTLTMKIALTKSGNQPTVDASKQPKISAPAPQKKIKVDNFFSRKDEAPTRAKHYLESRQRWHEFKLLRNLNLSIKILEQLQRAHLNQPEEQQQANNIFAAGLNTLNPCHLVNTDRSYALQWISIASRAINSIHLIIAKDTEATNNWMSELKKADINALQLTPDLVVLEPNKLIEQIIACPCWVVSQDTVNVNLLDLLPFDVLLFDNTHLSCQFPKSIQQIYFNSDNQERREAQPTLDLMRLRLWDVKPVNEKEYNKVRYDYAHAAIKQPMIGFITYFKENKYWPLSNVSPRDYQLPPMQQYLQTRAEGKHAVFAFSTGSGKTYLFSMLTGLTNDRVLVVVPRKNLVDQTIAAYQRFLPGIKIAKAVFQNKKIGNIHANINQPYLQVLVTTYQSLQKHYDKVNFCKLNALYLDEAHNSLSEARINVVNTAKNAGLQICAFTATPYLDVRRSADDKGFIDVYTLCDYEADGSDCVIQPFTIRDAITVGANVPVVMHHVMPTIMENIHISTRPNQEISEQQAAKLMDNDKANRMMADLYLNGTDPQSKRNYRGQKGIIFCSGVEHTKHMEVCLDDVILSNYQLTDADVSKINDIYYQMEKKAYDKQNKNNKFAIPYQRDILWKNGINEKYYDVAKAKAKRRLAIAVIDPNGYLRTRYADNIAADYKRRTNKELSKTNWQRAYDRFRVAKAVHSGNANLENLSDNKCVKIIKKFQLGGYLLLAGADKLTEGFDDPEVNLVFFMRPTKSSKVITQGVGRGLRVNAKDPNKVCSVFQLHMTNELLDCKMVHELISEGIEPVFQYGAADERRKAHPKTTLPPILITDVCQYRIVSSPAEGKIHLPPPAPPRKPSKSAKKTRKATGLRRKVGVDTLTPLQNQISEIDKILDKVMETFQVIKNDIKIEILTKSDMTEALVFHERKPASHTSVSKKRERNDDDIPDEIREFIDSTKGKLNQIKKVINYFNMSGKNESPASSTSQASKNRYSEEMIATARERVNAMMKRLKGIFNTKIVGLLSEYSESERVEEELGELTQRLETIVTHLEPHNEEINEENKVIDKNRNIDNTDEINRTYAMQYYQYHCKEAERNEKKFDLTIEKIKNISPSFSDMGSILGTRNPKNFDTRKFKIGLIEVYLSENKNDPIVLMRFVLDDIMAGSYGSYSEYLVKHPLYRDIINYRDENKTILDIIHKESKLTKANVFLHVVKHGFDFMLDANDNRYQSKLMGLIIKEDELLFLLCVAYGAKLSDLKQSEQETILNNPSYVNYYHALKNQQPVLGGKPLLYEIATMKGDTFDRIYHQCHLEDQTHMLKDKYEPDWSTIAS